MSVDILASNLKSIVRDFASDFEKIRARDEARVRARLQPGDYMPGRLSRNGFFTVEARDEARSAATAATAEARRLIEAERARASAALSEPPSPDALRAIEALKLNPALDEATVTSAMERYGSNALAAAAIRGVAAESRIHVRPPADSAADVLDKVAELEKFAYRTLDADGMASAAFSPMVEAATFGGQADDIVAGVDIFGSPR